VTTLTDYATPDVGGNPYFSCVSAYSECVALFLRGQVLHNGSLYINGTQLQDAGLYTCLLHDGVEQRTMTATLSVVARLYCIPAAESSLEHSSGPCRAVGPLCVWVSGQ